MALSDATQPITRAILAGVGGVDILHQQPAPFRSVRHTLAHQAALPLAQAATDALPYVQLPGRLQQRQPLEHQYRVGGCPRYQPGGGLLAEGACAVALLATRPFQQESQRARVLPLCLAGRKLFLETAAGSAGADLSHLGVPPTDKEGIAIGIDGNQGVGLIQNDTDRMHTLWIGNTEGDDHATEQAPVALDHGHIVDLDGFSQRCLEGVRHRVGDALPSCHRPDRQRTIITEASIPPARANQKRRRRSLELERTLRGLLVRLSAGVGSGNEPDGRTGHLTADRALDVLVHRPMQRQRRQRFAVVVTRVRDALLNALKLCQRCAQIRVIGNAYRECALDVHVFYCITESATKQVEAVNVVVLTAFLRLKSVIPCGGLYKL